MATEEDHTVYGEEEDDDDESEEEDLALPTSVPTQEDLDDDDDDDDEDDVDVEEEEEEDDISSSSNLVASAGEVTVAIAGVPNVTSTQGGGGSVTVVDSLTDPKKKREQRSSSSRIEEDVMITAVVEEKKPLDESRKLFQRLWTDEDEIELLQGFLDYTMQRERGGNNSSHHHHHDTTVFYDQIKSKLQLDFNKNQLVEKLRRLKKKYRNVLNKIDSGSGGKEYIFKSPHDQATFEISRKIWSGAAGSGGGGGGGVEVGGFEDEELNPPNPNSFDHHNNGVDANNCSEKKVSRPRKRSRGGGGVNKIDEKHQFNQQSYSHQTAAPTTASSVPNLIEDTVRSCLSPLFKELLLLLHNSSMNGPTRGFAALNPMPLSFGGPATLNFTGFGVGGDMMDDKWRKQQILELEVYSKRLELVQDQIKSALEELRSMGP